MANSLTSDELRDTWAITRRHLAAANNFLPSSPVEDPEEGARVGLYEEMLSYNELELAMEALAALGETNASPSQFWQELIAAAENMGNQQHAARYRQRQSETNGAV